MIPVVLGMLFFSILHSLLAGQNSKRWIRERLGVRRYYGLYRIAYNLISVVTLAPLIWVAYFVPSAMVWEVPEQWRLVLVAIQVVGLLGLIISLMQIDLGQFIGLSQLRAFLYGAALPLSDEALQIDGLYAVVRHPLYLFSLLFIWPMPVMTIGLLAFNVGVTLYVVIGSRLEERRLVAAFGEPYVEYQRRVPWLFPKLWRH